MDQNALSNGTGYQKLNGVQKRFSIKLLEYISERVLPFLTF